VGLKKWLRKEYSVEIDASVPYAHWENAVERDMATVKAGASALLHGQEWLQADAWDLDLHHFVGHAECL
jgi:hypothetical protein